MAYIDPEGLFGGDRMAMLSDSAKFAWPWFWCASNTVGRVELNYRGMCDTVFRQFKKHPTESQFWNWVSEFHEAFLMFVYEVNGNVWGQWDVSEKYLPKYKTNTDRKTPAPAARDFVNWQKRYVEYKRTNVVGKCRVLNVSGNFPEIPANSPVSIDLDVVIGEENNTGASAPVTPIAPRKKAGKTPGLSAEQGLWFAEYLSVHPKPDIQTASAKRIFAKGVTARECFDWLISELRKDAAPGKDTTYLHGPGRWLEDHLALYEAGIRSREKTGGERRLLFQ